MSEDGVSDSADSIEAFEEAMVADAMIDCALGEVVGTGQFSKVFALQAPSVGTVAVKVLDVGEGSRSNSARDEAMLIRRCSHPFVIRCFGFKGSSISLEMCESSVDRIVEEIRRKPITIVEAEQTALCLCAEIALGLARIHAAGVMHRDIKPSNLLLRNGRIRIADFGFATSSATSSAHLGTAYYMAPEVATCGTYDKSADMWSLGCTLLEMICGRVAFHGVRMLAQLVEAQTRPFPIPIVISEATQDLLRRLMAFHASDRITAAAALCHPAIGPFVEAVVEQVPGALRGTGVDLHTVRQGRARRLRDLGPLPALSPAAAARAIRKPSDAPPALFWIPSQRLRRA
jgi:serine/threonine protein kinase